MSTQSERIRQLVVNSKLSYQELELKTGITKSSLQRYASGKTSKIPSDAIEKLSRFFNVSQAYLMSWSDEKETPTTEMAAGAEILKMFNSLSLEKQKQFRDYLLFLLSQQDS